MSPVYPPLLDKKFVLEVYSQSIKIKIMRKLAFGIVLVIVGVLMMGYTGFNRILHKETRGAAVITIRKNHVVEWSPVVGLVLFVTGILLFVKPRRMDTMIDPTDLMGSVKSVELS
jgi:uncharacterized protein YjeT (DUF2065 family)